MLYFLCLTLFYLIDPMQSLEELPSTEYKDIVETESIIRNTFNSIFLTLNLSSHKKPKLRQFATIHNFFTSITLRDQDNLNQIARMADCGRIDNTTHIFMTQLNIILNDSNKNYENTQLSDDGQVATYIATFLHSIEQLKEKYGLTKELKEVNANSGVLKQITQGVTKEDALHDDDDNVLTDNEFWEPVKEFQSRRIYKGRATRIRSFPFMAAVLFFGNFQCAGSIIGTDLIITAASCLQLAWNNIFFRENPSFLSVRIGSDFHDYAGEAIPVSTIKFHPSYDPKISKDNLAILRTNYRMNLKQSSKRVKKIEFDRNAWQLAMTTPGITIVGWGAKGISNLWKNRLAYDKLNIYPWKDCQSIYNRDLVTEKNFCAGSLSDGRGACNHDAGGPGLVGGILMGVISFGSPICGAPNTPTVFTKLGFYTDWIEQVIEEQVSTRDRATTKRTTHTTWPSLEIDEVKDLINNDEFLNVLTEEKGEGELRSFDSKGNKVSLFKNFLSAVFESDEIDTLADDKVPNSNFNDAIETDFDYNDLDVAEQELVNYTGFFTKMFDINEEYAELFDAPSDDVTEESAKTTNEMKNIERIQSKGSIEDNFEAFVSQVMQEHQEEADITEHTEAVTKSSLIIEDPIQVVSETQTLETKPTKELIVLMDVTSTPEISTIPSTIKEKVRHKKKESEKDKKHEKNHDLQDRSDNYIGINIEVYDNDNTI